jgi:hypothetical protein
MQVFLGPGFCSMLRGDYLAPVHVHSKEIQHHDASEIHQIGLGSTEEQRF